MKAFQSIQFKLLSLSLLTMFVVISVGAVLAIHFIKTRTIEMQRERAMGLSRDVTQNIRLLMLNNRWGELRSYIGGLQKNDASVRVRVVHPVSCLIIISSDPKEVGTKATSDCLVSPNLENSAPDVGEQGGIITVRHAMSIKNMPACHKCHSPLEQIRGILSVDVSSSINRFIRQIIYEHVTGVILSFIMIALFFVYWGNKFIKGPLGDLVQAMRRVEAGDLTARATVKSNDEFGYLTKVFNNMIGSLESARKEIETYHAEQLDRASKLASLGEMVSGIAHEIKNPLAGLNCAIQMLSPALRNDPEKKEHIAVIKEYIGRLDRVVKDVLNYAKMTQPHFVPARISSVLDKALFFLYPEAKRQNVVIHTDVEKDLPVVIIDPDQIQQVFINIILNAVQAMPEGGVLNISVFTRQYKDIKDEVSMTMDTDRVVVARFQDAGAGISHEDVQRIFVPFFTRKPQGTGLGLSISQRIIQEHGSEITVKSTIGEGSVFSVYIPVRNQG